MLGNCQCWAILLIWIIVGQESTVLAVGASWGYLDIFFHACHTFYLFLLADGYIQTEILSKRATRPKKNHSI